MRKVLYIVFSIFWVVSCGQDKKSDGQKSYDISQYIFPEAKDVTQNNFVEKLNYFVTKENEDMLFLEPE